MSAWKFFWLNFAGAVLWVLALGVAGRTVGHVIEALKADVHRHEWLFAGLLLSGVFAVVAWGSRGRELRDIGTLIRRPGRLANESIRWLAEQSARPHLFLSRSPRDPAEGDRS